MFRSIPLVFSLFVLGGCAASQSNVSSYSDSGVIPLGNNAFIVSKQAANDSSGVGSIKAEALHETSTQCLNDGRAVDIQNIQETRPSWWHGVHAQIEIRFRCIEESVN